MSAKPNLDMVEKVKTLLPQAVITHSNNTIMVVASSAEEAVKWRDLLRKNSLSAYTHNRFPLTLVISMWPHRQIVLSKTALRLNQSG